MPSPRQWPTPVTTTWVERPVHRPLDARRVARRKQPSAAERERGKRDVHRRIAARHHGRDRCRWRAPARPACSASKARSSAVAGSAPVAPEITATAPAFGRRRQLVATSAPSAAVTAPGWPAASARTCTLDEPRQRLGAARLGMVARFEHQERAERAEREAAASARAPRPARTCPCRHVAAELVEQQQVLALGVVARRRPARCRSGRPRCATARCAPRRRRPTSSPMKVRDEPVTPCTIEMLPASRLESCARNSVGRRSLISRSLRKASGFVGLAACR